MALDPITIEVVANRFREIAATMEHALYQQRLLADPSRVKRRHRRDADAGGRVIIVSGGLQYRSRSVTNAHGEQRCWRVIRASACASGDSFIVNDPYLAGNPHAPTTWSRSRRASSTAG